MGAAWRELSGRVDRNRFKEVSAKLEEQLAHATRWREACVSFFEQQQRGPAAKS
jgi:alpha-glucuronidase